MVSPAFSRSIGGDTYVDKIIDSLEKTPTPENFENLLKEYPQLLQNGLNTATNEGRTVLTVAIKINAFPLVKAILEKEPLMVHKNWRPKDGLEDYPYTFLASQYSARSLGLLLEMGADIKEKVGKYEFNLFHSAAHSYEFETNERKAEKARCIVVLSSALMERFSSEEKSSE